MFADVHVSRASVLTINFAYVVILLCAKLFLLPRYLFGIAFSVYFQLTDYAHIASNKTRKVRRYQNVQPVAINQTNNKQILKAHTHTKKQQQKNKNKNKNKNKTKQNKTKQKQNKTKQNKTHKKLGVNNRFAVRY